MPTMRRIVVIAVTLVATLVMMADDVTFLNNRRQWEKLPTATLNRMGFTFYEKKSMPDSALLCYTILANRLQNKQLHGKELEQCIGATINLGNLYLGHYNDFHKAYSFLLQAEELANQYHKKNLLAHVYINLANLYSFETQLNASKPHEDQVWTTYKKAFYIGIDNEEWGPIIPSFITMIEMAFAMGQLDSVAHEITTFSNLTIPDTVQGVQYAKKLCQGILLWQNNLSDKALNSFNNLDNSEDWPNNGGFAKSASIIKHIILYIAYHHLGQDEKALEQIIESERLAKQHDLPDGVMAAYQNYAEYYTDLGDAARADYYRLKRYELQDSVVAASHVNDVNTVRFLHEIDKMNEEQRALALKHRHDKQMLWIVSIAAMAATVMLILLAISRHHIRDNYRQLYDKNQELLATEDGRRREAIAAQVAGAKTKTSKYGHNRMEDDVKDELWQQIVHIMDTSEEIFSESFTIDRLAELLGAKKPYVSQTINTKTGNAFTVLLNEYRIREACRRMNDNRNYGNYSVEGIAQSVGYNSRSHFAKLFKAATGVPPSTYMRMARNNEESCH